MNTEYLRQSLKTKWLTYYRDNRSWLARLAVWVECDGERRPSSGFILATLSILEPQLPQLFPIIVELSNNPDRIVMALGLNFNPDDELNALEEEEDSERSLRLLPEGNPPLNGSTKQTRTFSAKDESCYGAWADDEGRDRV